MPTLWVGSLNGWRCTGHTVCWSFLCFILKQVLLWTDHIGSEAWEVGITPLSSLKQHSYTGGRVPYWTPLYSLSLQLRIYPARVSDWIVHAVCLCLFWCLPSPVQERGKCNLFLLYSIHRFCIIYTCTQDTLSNGWFLKHVPWKWYYNMCCKCADLQLEAVIHLSCPSLSCWRSSLTKQ